MSKVWLITGAGRGMGADMVRAALAAGDRVVATGRSVARLQQSFPGVAAERLLPVALDVRDQAQARAAVEAAVAAFGRIDVLVNNAGYPVLGNFEEVSAAEIEQQFATNVFGAMHVTRAVLPVMRRQRAGHVLCISSVGGLLAFPSASAYCASKFALEGFSLSLAQEVAGFGIHVTVVEPGFFRTELLSEQSVNYGAGQIEDYAAGGNVKATWDSYNGQQAGDPAKLAAVMVELTRMAQPPRQFLVGSDAVAMVPPALEARLQEIRTHAALSSSTDGNF